MKLYVKLDAPDTLLLSENVCYKLKIVSYHPDVQPVLDHEPGQWRSKRPSQWKSKRKSKKAKIKLIQTICLPADGSDKQRKRSSRKKSSQQSKEADDLLPNTDNQGGEQPRSPYNLRYRQRRLARNINLRLSLVSRGHVTVLESVTSSADSSHLIS